LSMRTSDANGQDGAFNVSSIKWQGSSTRRKKGAASVDAA
jgi:hypothetical protein